MDLVRSLGGHMGHQGRGDNEPIRIANASFVPQPEPSIPDDTDPMGRASWIHPGGRQPTSFTRVLPQLQDGCRPPGATNVEAFDEGF